MNRNTDSDTNRKAISVIGAGSCDARTAELAQELGKRIAEAGYDLVCGGLGGVMEAACRGARQAGGRTIGILPGHDRQAANAFVDVPIATGLSEMRNALVVMNGLGAVAVQGGAGTLSEIGLALKTGKPVVALGNWASLPGVVRAENSEQAVNRILELTGER